MGGTRQDDAFSEEMKAVMIARLQGLDGERGFAFDLSPDPQNFVRDAMKYTDLIKPIVRNWPSARPSHNKLAQAIFHIDFNNDYCLSRKRGGGGRAAAAWATDMAKTLTRMYALLRKMWRQRKGSSRHESIQEIKDLFEDAEGGEEGASEGEDVKVGGQVAEVGGDGAEQGGAAAREPEVANKSEDRKGGEGALGGPETGADDSNEAWAMWAMIAPEASAGEAAEAGADDSNDKVWAMWAMLEPEASAGEAAEAGADDAGGGAAPGPEADHVDLGESVLVPLEESPEIMEDTQVVDVPGPEAVMELCVGPTPPEESPEIMEGGDAPPEQHESSTLTPEAKQLVEWYPVM